MTLNSTALVSSANGWTADFPFLSVHTDVDAASSAAESSAARRAAGWAVDAAGDATASNVAFTGGASSGPALRIGYWSLVSGGVFGGSIVIPDNDGNGDPNDKSFNAAGEFTVRSLVETSTAS